MSAHWDELNINFSLGRPLSSGAAETVLLQAQGSPGESFEVQASTNLQTWLDLGSITADTNGLAQFGETNAPAFNSRFYLTVPQ
jgi:hypothetical protein